MTVIRLSDRLGAKNEPPMYLIPPEVAWRVMEGIHHES